MNAPKPHIKPKADPFRQQTEQPDRDVPVYGAWDAPVFDERDGGGGEQKADQAVLYYEDDCLR